MKDNSKKKTELLLDLNEIHLFVDTFFLQKLRKPSKKFRFRSVGIELIDNIYIY